MATHTQKSISGKKPDRRRKASAMATGSKALLVAALVAGGAGLVYAKGGTAKPPGGGGGGGGVPPPAGACPSGAPAGSACIVPPAGPVLPNFPQPAVPAAGAISGNGSNGFSITGLVQRVALTGTTCTTVYSNQTHKDAKGNLSPIQTTAGGTVTVNGLTITVPSNTIVQYPANTLTWADAVCGISKTSNPPIDLNNPHGPTGGVFTAAVYPGVEISIDGNITTSTGAAPGPTANAGAATPHVAGLIRISQQSLHSGVGYISNINYTTGVINVTSGGATINLLINDPKGRFGRAQSSTDARFSVDDANPTIKSGATGYPMCVPRSTNPATGVLYGTTNGIPNDPLCPQKNRPRNTCRNFGAAGITFRVGADLPTTPPVGSTICSGFVMKAIAGMPGTGPLQAPLPPGAQSQIANISADTTTGDPDPRQMAPFEVGDYITWQGTLVHTPNTATTGDVIWVHTIDANVGIYTQPGTLPAYIAVGENGFGVNPETAAAVAVAGVEATARMFVEASTTDVSSIVDIYYDDKGFSLSAPKGPLVPDPITNPPTPASEYFRWLTPESMTGTLADQALQAGKGVFIPSSSVAQATVFGGGIYTQFAGPQPGRARIRAIKVPAIDGTLPCPNTAQTIGGTRGCAITQSPTRYIRAVLRSLCAPAGSGTLDESAVPTAVPSTGNLDNGVNGSVVDSGAFFDINGARPSLPGAAAGDGSCLQSAIFANGLSTGQYMAPIGEYIFPENTLSGFRILPYNFWHMGFMAYGENGADGNSTAPQAPRPW